VDEPNANGAAGPRVEVGTAADLTGRDRADDIRPVDLDDGRRAFVRIMTLEELELFQGEWSSEDRRDTMARIILATACDRSGTLLFRPDQLAEVKRMRARDALAISNRSLEINMLTKESIEPLKKDLPETIENN
jgi:hypothetical protein